MKINKIAAVLSMILMVAGGIPASAAEDASTHTYPVGGLIVKIPSTPQMLPSIEIPEDNEIFKIQSMNEMQKNKNEGMMSCSIMEEKTQIPSDSGEGHEEYKPFVPVYTNVDCVLTEDNAPEAIRSLEDGLAIFGAEVVGKTFHMTSSEEKRFVYPIAGCDGVIKVSSGGNVEFIANQDESKQRLIIGIQGSGAYTPVILN